MANPASTPEFRAILQDMYDSGKYRTSGQVLQATWKEYRRQYGRGVLPSESGAYRSNPKKKAICPACFSKYTERGIKRGERYCKDCGTHFTLSGKPLKNNPGAKWHLTKATKAHLKAKRSPDKEERDHQIGHFEAHLESATEARRMGLNPGKRYRHAVSKRQQRFMGSELGRRRAGKKTVTEMSEKQLSEFARNSNRTTRYYEKQIKKYPKGSIVRKRLEQKLRQAQENPIAIYNPPYGKLLPMTILEIRYQRKGGEYHRELFKHDFKSRPRVYGLPDGSILLKSNKRLWGMVD